MLRHALLFALIVPLGAPIGLSAISAANAPFSVESAEDGRTTGLTRDVAALSEAELVALSEIAPAAGAQMSLNDLVIDRLEALDQGAGEEAYCLGQAVYFEARGEPLEGQLAVAQVVLNRVADRRYPDSVCEVVFQNDHLPFRCQFSFACDGMVDRPYNKQSWKLARAVADIAMSDAWRDLTDQSTHYHAVYVAPYWRAHLEKTVQLGAHIFYRS